MDVAQTPSLEREKEGEEREKETGRQRETETRRERVREREREKERERGWWRAERHILTHSIQVLSHSLFGISCQKLRKGSVFEVVFVVFFVVGFFFLFL